MSTEESQLDLKVEKSMKVIEKALSLAESPAVVVSGGKDSTVMLDLVMRVVREKNFDCPLVLLCDPIPFPENVEFCKKLIKYYSIPEEKAVFYEQFSKKYLESEEFKREVGEVARDKKKCCYYLKVLPLKDFIREYSVDYLFVAIRWDEHPERAKEKYFSPREDHTRVHPMLHWTWLDIWLYIKRENVPVNPLYFKGYTSLGCVPCTTIVKEGGFKDIDEIIEFVKKNKGKERAGRDIDKEKIMESLRKLGYF